jgi:hypothetical protein
MIFRIFNYIKSLFYRKSPRGTVSKERYKKNFYEQEVISKNRYKIYNIGLRMTPREHTESLLLNIPGIKNFNSGHNHNYIYLDIENSKEFYIRISVDGKFVFCEYDPGEPGPIIRRDVDVVLSKIPKETAKGLCFHLDLFW